MAGESNTPAPRRVVLPWHRDSPGKAAAAEVVVVVLALAYLLDVAQL